MSIINWHLAISIGSIVIMGVAAWFGVLPGWGGG